VPSSFLLSGAFGVAALSGGAPASAPSAQAPPQPTATPHIRDIVVDTAPLLAQSGNPTAQWAQDALPADLARSFAAHMAPDDPNGQTLNVRIDSINLASIGPQNGAIDTIKGVATLDGVMTRLRATAFFTPDSVDQALWEQAMQGRVTTLTHAFAQSLRRKMGM
jgi:hypothetical protein